MENNKDGWKEGREVGKAGVLAGVGGKGRKVYLNNNLKNVRFSTFPDDTWEARRIGP